MTRAYYNEFEPFAAEWLGNLERAGHIAPGAVDSRSIKQVSANDLDHFQQCHFFAGIGVWSHALRLAGWPDWLPVWTGSCPCQPFSGAGAGGGFDDPRHLWPDWFKLIGKHRPAVVLGEQVASPDGLEWLDLVFSDLEGAGYSCAAADLCAAGVGAPHIRQRIFFVAYSDREPWRLQLRSREPRREDPQARGRGETRWVADASGRRLEARHLFGASQAAVGEGQRSQRIGLVGAADELGDAAVARLEGKQHRRPDGGARHEGPAAQRAGAARAGTVGDSGLDGDQQHDGVVPGDEGEHEERGAFGDHAPILAGATRGFWADADWLYCIDGKYRATEPGSFPLAHGATERVGRLRAYGNAIVAPLAAAFIEAVMQTLEGT